MSKVIIFITDCGNGHRSCANSLNYFLSKKNQFEIEIVNPYTKILNINNEAFYNKHYHKKFFLLICPLLIMLLKLFVKLNSKIFTKKITKYLQEEKPAKVISLMPYLNGVFSSACKNCNIKDFSVILTDWSDEKRIWLDSKIPNLFCNTEDAKNLANSLNIKEVNLTSGMILKTTFYQSNFADEKLNLSDNKLTFLIMYGLGTTKETLNIINKLDYLADKIQFIILTGNNTILFDSLKNYSGKMQIFPIPFTNNPSPYFKQADIFIGKSGPGSLSEALFFNLPIITTKNIYTLPQERFNANYLNDKDFATVLSSYSKLIKVIPQIISGELKLNKPNLPTNNGVLDISEKLS